MELLLERLDELKTRICKSVVQAAQDGRFDEVRELINKIDGLVKVEEQAETLQDNLLNLFDQSPLPKPPEPKPDNIRLELKKKIAMPARYSTEVPALWSC